MTRITLARIGKNQTVNYAAEELYTYLKKIDPQLFVDVRVYSDYSEGVSDVIWVGQSEAFSQRLLSVEDPKLDDSICIDVKNNAGIITGSNPRAVLIAAYRFLKELGVAWIRPTDDGEVVPEYTITALNVSVQEKASCRHRTVCIEGSTSYEHVLNLVKWLPRAGMSGYYFQFFRPYHFFNKWYSRAHNRFLAPGEISREDVDALVEQLEEEIEKRDLILTKVGHGWSCEPFGIPSDGWFTVKDEDIPEDFRPYLALVDGKRTYFKEKPVFTNLCYSNPEAREIMAEAAAAYCADHPNMRCLYFSLADGSNNYCECENCTQRPSDYIVMIMNRLDEKLTERGLDTKVAFSTFTDKLWHPLKEKLNNPKRFILSSAPITRSFNRSYDEVDVTKDYPLPPYVRNQIELPEALEDVYAFYKGWRSIDCYAQADSLVFDYHLMWAHLSDPGYYAISKVLFRDMQAMHTIGWNGMISCQLTRCSFPTNLPMQMMADGLWNETCDFEEKSSHYFASAYGPEGEAVKAYMKAISTHMDPDFSNRFPSGKPDPHAKPIPSPETRLTNMLHLKGIIEEFGSVIERNLAKDLPDAQHKSWEYLRQHKFFVNSLADIVIAGITESEEAQDQKIDAIKEWILLHETQLHKVMDTQVTHNNIKRIYKGTKQTQLYE